MSCELPQIGSDAVFLVWGPPSHGPRSTSLARELGIKELHFVQSLSRRGALTAPLRYLHMAFQTAVLLARKRPNVIFVQSPPQWLVFVVYLYSLLTGSQFVVDAHSAAMQLDRWKRPYWLTRLMSKRAAATIVTNEHFKKQIERHGGVAFVLPNVFTTFPLSEFPLPRDRFRIAVINTFAFDEPVEAVLEAAREVPDVDFYVTGRKSRADQALVGSASENVNFTDFLPDEQFFGLLDSSHAVMVLTTRNHTMQNGACEALSLGVPIITSDWPLLRDYFNRGTVHVHNDAPAIREGVLAMKQSHERYLGEIRELKEVREREWCERIHALVALIYDEKPAN